MAEGTPIGRRGFEQNLRLREPKSFNRPRPE